MNSWLYGSNGQKLKDVILIPDDTEVSRKLEYNKIIEKNPNLIAIIIHPIGINMLKCKYLVSPDLKFEKFAIKARTYCPDLAPNQPLFFSANDVWISKNDLMSDVYSMHQKADKFLHINMYPEPEIYPLEVVVKPPTTTSTNIIQESKTETEKSKIVSPKHPGVNFL